MKLDKLTAHWYQILKKDGFRDIEYSHGWERGSPRVDERASVQLEAIEAYYRLARYFLNEYKFESNLDMAIWEYHSEGFSYREISKLLKPLKIKKLQKSRIGDTVKRLENIMKRTYLNG